MTGAVPHEFSKNRGGPWAVFGLPTGGAHCFSQRTKRTDRIAGAARSPFGQSSNLIVRKTSFKSQASTCLSRHVAKLSQPPAKFGVSDAPSCVLATVIHEFRTKIPLGPKRFGTIPENMMEGSDDNGVRSKDGS